jgi:hypothetical protein
MARTFSIPSWTTSAFSSTVTDLFLIYESVISSVSTLHSWTLHFWILLRLTYDGFSLTNQITNQLRALL